MAVLNVNLRSRLVRMALPIACLSGVLLGLSEAAQANCAGFGRDPNLSNKEIQQRWQQLQTDESHFWGKTPMFATITADRLTLTRAFDRLTGPEKQQVLHTLQLDGSTYTVYTADGRLVSAQYDGCTRTQLLTERDRFRWYLNRPPTNVSTNLLGEALRNAGTPSWRTVTYPIQPQAEKQVRLQFWQTVGYGPTTENNWIAWVPEGGYFEITVGNADGLTPVQRFLSAAPSRYRYQVVARDGTPLLDTLTTRGNPWRWILGKTSVPSGWQIKLCDRESPFLCVFQKGQRVGSIEVQRWNLDKMPRLFSELTRLGLTPGLLTYSNPNDTAKVREALQTLVADYHQTIATDRAATYGKTTRFQRRPTVPVQLGTLPGLRYGFQGVEASGRIRERYVTYMAFDGSQTLYILTTCFDPLASSGKFKDLASLERFEPHLQAIAANLNLPFDPLKTP